MARLEALACGVPVITPNTDPMAEPLTGALGLDADRWLLPIVRVEEVATNQPWKAHHVSSEVLCRNMAALLGTGIKHDSDRLRDYMLRVHGDSAWRHLTEIIWSM